MLELKKAEVLEILDIEEGVSNNNKKWSKIGFVVKDLSVDFERNILLDAWGDKIAEVKALKKGNIVKIVGFVSSKLHVKSGRWFTNAALEEVTVLNVKNPVKSNGSEFNDMSMSDDDFDDLPFN